MAYSRHQLALPNLEDAHGHSRWSHKTSCASPFLAYVTIISVPRHWPEILSIACIDIVTVIANSCSFIDTFRRACGFLQHGRFVFPSLSQTRYCKKWPRTLASPCAYYSFIFTRQWYHPYALTFNLLWFVFLMVSTSYRSSLARRLSVPGGLYAILSPNPVQTPKHYYHPPRVRLSNWSIRNLELSRNIAVLCTFPLARKSQTLSDVTSLVFADHGCSRNL